jgi:trk system potassium uptake protein TrkH
MLQQTGSMARYPAQALFACYLSAILIGGTILALPTSRQPDARPISFVDACFTATSAVCVTGLSVRSTGHDFSFFGQLTILVLVQLGGIGIITVTTFVMLLMTGRVELRQQTTFTETLGTSLKDRLYSVAVRVIGLTLVIELIGAVFLYIRFLDHPGPSPIWRAVFHSVSAFCNAGFGLDDQNLSPYRSDVGINVTVMCLIVVGGLGFPIMVDLWRTGRRVRREGSTHPTWKRYLAQLQPTTKLVLLGTVVLIVGGAALILFFEWTLALKEYPWQEKVLVALFQSVTTRTAGFNTIDLQALSNATLFLFMLLMFIGGGPCSTAGGAKVSTISVLLMQAWQRMRGEGRVVAFRRTISGATLERANMIVMLFVTFIVLGLIGILLGGEPFRHYEECVGSQPRDFFMKSMFEVVSALGTVGLSLGITPNLSDWSKICLMVLMFAGRLGPISLVLAVSRPVRNDPLRYASQEVLTG